MESSARALFANERRLARLIREDWNANLRDWTQPGFRALAVHRVGTWAHQLRFRPIRAVLVRVHHMLFRYVRNHYGIELPLDAVVGRRLLIGHQNGIVINPNAVIGDDCIIRHNVTLGTTSVARGAEAPTIGDGVSLGVGAAILGGITIGDRAMIGPNTVVMMDVPADTAVFASTPRFTPLHAPVSAVPTPDSVFTSRTACAFSATHAMPESWGGYSPLSGSFSTRWALPPPIAAAKLLVSLLSASI
jgi:serine O-acetyltransferase